MSWTDRVASTAEGWGDGPPPGYGWFWVRRAGFPLPVCVWVVPMTPRDAAPDADGKTALVPGYYDPATRREVLCGELTGEQWHPAEVPEMGSWTC